MCQALENRLYDRLFLILIETLQFQYYDPYFIDKKLDTKWPAAVQSSNWNLKPGLSGSNHDSSLSCATLTHEIENQTG